MPSDTVVIIITPAPKPNGAPSEITLTDGDLPSNLKQQLIEIAEQKAAQPSS